MGHASCHRLTSLSAPRAPICAASAEIFTLYSLMSCCLQKTLDELIDRGDISSRDLDNRTMDALEGERRSYCHLPLSPAGSHACCSAFVVPTEEIAPYMC